MNRNMRSILLGTTGIAAALATTSAFAQDALETIIVTAEKVSTDIQKTSVSITAIQPDTAAQAGQTRLKDMLLNIPAVAYNFTPVQPQGWCKFVPLQGGGTLTLNTLDKSHTANNRPVLLNWR